MRTTFRISEGHGRCRVSVRVYRLGPDVVVLVTGGASHLGAFGWLDAPEIGGSHEFAGHRDGVLTETFLKSLQSYPGRKLVTAGVHLDNITPDEIESIVSHAAVLASRVKKTLEKEFK